MSELILDPNDRTPDVTFARDRGLEALVDRLLAGPSNVVHVQFGSRTVAKHLERQDGDRAHLRASVFAHARSLNLCPQQQAAAVGEGLAAQRAGKSLNDAIEVGKKAADAIAGKMRAIKSRLGSRPDDDGPQAA